MRKITLLFQSMQPIEVRFDDLEPYKPQADQVLSMIVEKHMFMPLPCELSSQVVAMIDGTIVYQGSLESAYKSLTIESQNKVLMRCLDSDFKPEPGVNVALLEYLRECNPK